MAAHPSHTGPGTHTAWQETHGPSCWGDQAGRCQGPHTGTSEVKARPRPILSQPAHVCNGTREHPKLKPVPAQSSHSLLVYVMGAGTWGKNWRFPVKLKQELPCDPAIPLPSISPGEAYIQPHKRSQEHVPHRFIDDSGKLERRQKPSGKTRRRQLHPTSLKKGWLARPWGISH